MLRHPAEPYFPYIVALRAEVRRDEDPLPWVGAALERAHVYAIAHLLLAQVLTPKSVSQARLEYRLTMEQAPEFTGHVMARATRLVTDYFSAREVIPADSNSNRPHVMDLLALAVRDRLPATAARLDADLSRVAPEMTRLRAAEAATTDVEAGACAPWCEGNLRRTCLDDATAKAAQEQQAEPTRCEGYDLHARIRVSAGDPAGGIAELQDAVDAVADRVPCLERLTDLALKVGDVTRADAALQRIVAAGCVETAECTENVLWVSRKYESMGQSHKALALLKRVLELSPDDALLVELASAASRSGLHAEAAADYEELARKHPDQSQWQRAHKAERDAALREALKL
jgi:hypothetical protein